MGAITLRGRIRKFIKCGPFGPKFILKRTTIPKISEYPLIIALIFWVLSHIFMEGAKLKEANELTI